MDWKVMLKAALNAALNGAGASAIAVIGDPQHFQLNNIGTLWPAFVAGAMLGVLNYLKGSPIQAQQLEQKQSQIETMQAAGQQK